MCTNNFIIMVGAGKQAWRKIHDDGRCAEKITACKKTHDDKSYMVMEGCMGAW